MEETTITTTNCTTSRAKHVMAREHNMRLRPLAFCHTDKPGLFGVSFMGFKGGCKELEIFPEAPHEAVTKGPNHSL